VPVVPGDNGAGGKGFATLEEARAAAARIGYPVMLKAAAGGGGRGMRLVDGEDKLDAALSGASVRARPPSATTPSTSRRRSCARATSRSRCSATSTGSAVHLFERDCSVQRRNQKVIEEAPSPAIDDATRARMGEVAVRAARSVGYVGAGTIEMLYDQTSKSFYFSR
jgi:biotin carboxylase